MSASTAIQATPLRSPAITFRQHPSRAFDYQYTSALRLSSSNRSIVIAASKSTNSNADPPSEDNLKFLLKLGAGSFVGAAAIKYGSIIVPEITKPNITQALIMIITPVLVSVLILIKESTAE